jgi:hypothetical protein
MNIIHGFWLPTADDDFIQSGQFWLWVETGRVKGPPALPPEKCNKRIQGGDDPAHPRQLTGKALSDWLESGWLLQSNYTFARHSLWLPTQNGKVLPSPLLKHRDFEGKGFEDEDFEEHAFEGKSTTAMSLSLWQVVCVRVDLPLQALSQMHFLLSYQQNASEMNDPQINAMGSDLLFWHYFSQSVKQLLIKDQYLPGLIARDDGTIYRCWQIVSADHEAMLKHGVKQMPPVCHQGFMPNSLLRHFSEVNVNELLEQASGKIPLGVQKSFNETWLASFFGSDRLLGSMAAGQQTFAQWHGWQQRV